MLPSAKFPVILNPTNSGFSDKTVGKPPKPLLNLVVDADLAAKVGIYKLLEFQLSNLALKADLDFLVNLIKLLDPFMASDAAVQHAAMRTLDQVLRRRMPPAPVAQLTPDGNIRRDMVYFDVFRISALSVDLEYSISRKEIVSSAGGGNSIVFGVITQVVGLIGSNLSGSPTLSFSEIVIARCFSTKERLQSQLIQNFVRQAVLQAYRFVGSVDIIGDPIGLVEDLGSGVIEFLKITKDEVLGDSQTRGEGVKLLGKTIVRTGAAKITGSLDKFVGEFADEDDSANASATSSSKPAEGVTGLAPIDGGLKFAKDFGKGLTGIFTKPVEGAMKGGVTGLVQGTVQGIAGPGVVLLKQITAQVELTGNEQELQFVVKDSYGGAIDKTIGKCVLPMDQVQQDFRPPEYSSTLAQWVKTGQRPEETKKNVSNQVTQKEYTLYTRNDKSGGASALLGLGGSNKLRASDDDFQLLLTIGGLRDMRVTNKSMLHDETLGYTQLPVMLESTSSPIEKELQLHSQKGGAGEFIGFVTVKIETILATDSTDTSTPRSDGVATPIATLNKASSVTGNLKAGKIRVACEFS
ncbi:hypothetical protein P43SY_008892 [Pythium insidiosum]|uniref:Vacuolar protein sorting-associated protein 13 DH-like domain-containing protein n=1 Tax=Pythium insidiosum TaxID=114742 RepID=A0AAD5Q7K4_PYTIN|nr:hypothetical protein P43SY_008892 [Pythium insidiosum]